MRNKLNMWGAISIVAAIFAAVFLKIYLVREDSSGDVLWKDNESYLFIDVASRGAHFRYLEYPWIIFREFVGGVTAFNNESRSVTVIHITPSGIEQHVIEVAAAPPGSWPGEYTPFEDRIYANCPTLGGLCRWAGDRFEPATVEEQQRFDGINRLTTVDIVNAGAWSKHAIGAGPEGFVARSTTDVGGRFTILEKREPVGHSGYAAVSIYVQRSGAAPERVWYLDGHPRRVSRAEYENVFERR